MKTLEIGTVLEPKYDVNVGHAIVANIVRTFTGYQAYEVWVIKSNVTGLMTVEEIFEQYTPIGQASVGKALFGE